jgi:hypothetical protein
LYNIVEKYKVDPALIEAYRPNAEALAQVALEKGLPIKEATRVFQVALIRLALASTATERRPEGNQSDAARKIKMSQSWMNAVLRGRAFPSRPKKKAS